LVDERSWVGLLTWERIEISEELVIQDHLVFGVGCDQTNLRAVQCVLSEILENIALVRLHQPVEVAFGISDEGQLQHLDVFGR